MKTYKPTNKQKAHQRFMDISAALDADAQAEGRLADLAGLYYGVLYVGSAKPDDLKGQISPEALAWVKATLRRLTGEKTSFAFHISTSFTYMEQVAKQRRKISLLTK